MNNASRELKREARDQAEMYADGKLFATNWVRSGKAERQQLARLEAAPILHDTARTWADLIAMYDREAMELPHVERFEYGIGVRLYRVIAGRDDLEVGSAELFEMAKDFWTGVIIDEEEFAIDWMDGDDFALGFVEAALVEAAKLA
jgi:hypothetical protein